jgi:hypothetical protein
MQQFTIAGSSLHIQGTAKQLRVYFPTYYSVRANSDTLPEHVNPEASRTALTNISSAGTLG